MLSTLSTSLGAVDDCCVCKLLPSAADPSLDLLISNGCKAGGPTARTGRAATSSAPACSAGTVSPLLGDNHPPSALRALVPWCPPRRKLVCAGFGSARPQHPLGALVVTCRLDEPTERQTVLPHTYSTAAAFLCLPVAGLHPVTRVSASSVYSLRSPSSCYNLSARAISLVCGKRASTESPN